MVTIQITNAGANISNTLDIYTSVDGVNYTFFTNVTKTTLLFGYTFEPPIGAYKFKIESLNLICSGSSYSIVQCGDDPPTTTTTTTEISLTLIVNFGSIIIPTTTTTLAITTTTTTLSPTTTTTTTTPFIPFFTVDINNTNTEGWGYLEMDFNSDQTYYSGAYTQEEIGSVYIDNGTGITSAYMPFPQAVPDDYNNGLWLSTDSYYSAETYYVYYPPSTQHTLTFYSNGSKTAESVWLLYLYDLWVVDTLDMSMLLKISNFDCQNANITNIILPTSAHPGWGLDTFSFYNVSSLSGVNMSNMVLPNINLSGQTNNISIRNCPNMKIITLPTTSDLYWVSLNSNPLLEQVNIGINTISIGHFDLHTVPSLGYFDVTKIPNLTKAVNHNTYNNYDYGGYYSFQDNNYDATTINRMLVDLDSISVTVPVNITDDHKPTITFLGTNAAPDTTSGGYNGVAAKTSLQSKRFIVNTN